MLHLLKTSTTLRPHALNYVIRHVPSGHVFFKCFCTCIQDVGADVTPRREPGGNLRWAHVNEVQDDANPEEYPWVTVSTY
jgi:hypothetical protein